MDTLVDTLIDTLMDTLTDTLRVLSFTLQFPWVGYAYIGWNMRIWVEYCLKRPKIAQICEHVGGGGTFSLFNPM